MCGISGICNPFRITQVNQDQVALMLSIIRHRGPDSHGIYTNPDICFGSVRLAMTDSQSTINWLSNEDSSVLLVFNGEIYNHMDLRIFLEKQGHQFKTKSDGETIVHLYEEKGLDCLQELDGMFAFALWDSTKELLLLARDPLGIKPLYYQIEQSKLVFSSELKALIALSRSTPSIDLISLSSYFHYRFVAPPRSIFQKISKLEPGTFLIAQKGSITRKSYWKVIFGKQKKTIPSFLELWKETLRTTAISEFQIGLFLSGGLDSGGILTTLSKLQSCIPTFTIGYENSDIQDERPFAADLARFAKSQHEFQEIKRDEIADDLYKVIWHLEEPLYSTVSLSTYRLAKMASQQVKGVLSGDGSDELLLGYSYLLRVFDAFNKGKDWKKTYLYQIGWITGDWAKRLFSEELVQQKENLLQGCLETNPLDSMRHFEIKYRLAEYHLMRIDRLSMAHGLETRLPFLRKKLVEYLLSYPSNTLLIPGKQKEILKQAFANLLPKSTLKREKKPFTAPFIHWLKGPLKEEVYDLILGTNNHQALHLNKQGLQEVVTNCYRGNGSAFSVLWGLLTIYKWYEIYKKT